jgi:hypothetical protein
MGGPTCRIRDTLERGRSVNRATVEC